MSKCKKSKDGMHHAFNTRRIALFDVDSGFVQEIWQCKNCLLKSQRPTMLNISSLEGENYIFNNLITHPILMKNGVQTFDRITLFKQGKLSPKEEREKERREEIGRNTWNELIGIMETRRN